MSREPREPTNGSDQAPEHDPWAWCDPREAKKWRQKCWSASAALRRRRSGGPATPPLTEGDVTGTDLVWLLTTQVREGAPRDPYTNVALTPATTTLDHVVPRHLGGSDALSNLQWLHKDINAMKGSLTEVDFVAVCRLIVERYDGRLRRAQEPS